MFGKNGHLQVLRIPSFVDDIDLPLISYGAGRDCGCGADSFGIHTFYILYAEGFGLGIAVGWIWLYCRSRCFRATLFRFFLHLSFSFSLRSGPFLLIQLPFRLHFAKPAILDLPGLLWHW